MHAQLVIVIVISKLLKRYSKTKRPSLFPNAATNQREVFKGGVERSSGPIYRIPGGDRVAVKVGVVQVEKLNEGEGELSSSSRQFKLCNDLVLEGGIEQCN